MKLILVFMEEALKHIGWLASWFTPALPWDEGMAQTTM